MITSRSPLEQLSPRGAHVRRMRSVAPPPDAESPPSVSLIRAALFGGLLLLVVVVSDRPAMSQQPAGTADPAAAAAEAPLPGPIRPAGRTMIPNVPESVQFAANWFFIAAFAFASMIALWFAVERLVVLRSGRVIPRAFVDRFLQHLEGGKLDPASALKLCEENGSPVAMIFAHAVRKWGKPSVEIEQATIDGGERQVSQLRKHLRVLNGVATVTPLVGLLGTVWGMILAFSDIASSDAMGKAEELAAGIVLALLTTAAGLSIAIPSLVVYMYLAGRVDALVMEMDHLAQNVVYLISSEALSGRVPRPTIATTSTTRRRRASSPSSGSTSGAEPPAEKKAV
ncbi:MAG: MotA/TolQ/ExbB proton channel family protein [Planctomycetaceae bacterium]